MMQHIGILILLAVMGTVCGRAPYLKPLSLEMIDYINNYANTTWKVNYSEVSLAMNELLQCIKHMQ
jgi:hypothetical protein